MNLCSARALHGILRPLRTRGLACVCFAVVFSGLRPLASERSTCELWCAYNTQHGAHPLHWWRRKCHIAAVACVLVDVGMHLICMIARADPAVRFPFCRFSHLARAYYAKRLLHSPRDRTPPLTKVFPHPTSSFV